MNLSQLKQDINFLCGSTSATYLDADKIRNMNIANQEVAMLIWSSAGDWQYDDSNQTTLPIATTNLLHDQQDYTLPSTAQRVEEISVKNSDGHFHKLKPIDVADIHIAPQEYFSSPGLPLYYDLVGRSIMLYPSPASASCTLTSGMTVYVNRDINEFATSAAEGTTPGFATGYHRILSLAASIDFVQDAGQRQLLVAQKARLEKGLTQFYSKRAVESKVAIKPSRKRKWGQYI